MSSPRTNQRPDPDALLARVMAEEHSERGRGHLKVFLGAVAGVGKTYAMLEEAGRRRQDGTDVLVGVVETHGRADTEALLAGHEILPRRRSDHRGVELAEFDLDGALERQPRLILVDELAHSNAPGSRHAKRWQDVEELRSAGIDVYTTVNVQHLESLTDVVARITHVKVRETVPDSVLDSADEIELIDLPPDELLERLAQGKVYIPEQAKRAAESFFRKGNLIALRQLALRRAADRVDAQLQVYRRAQGVRETWPIAERILVAIGPAPSSQSLVRATKRMADRVGATWVAAFVETPEYAGFSRADRDRVWETLRLAERLGARTVTLSGSGTGELLEYARTTNVTRVVVGKPTHPAWRDRLFGSRVAELIRRSGDIDVYLLSGEGEEPTSRRPSSPHRRALRPYLLATAAVTLITLVSITLRGHVELSNITMLYLLGIIGIASQLERSAALFASVLSVAAFDYFCVPPYLTFAVADTRHLPIFVVMLLLSIVISTLTGRLRSQAVSSRQGERRSAALYELSRDLVRTHEAGQAVREGARHVGEVFESEVVILLPDPFGRLATVATHGEPPPEAASEQAVARWVLDHAQPAGLGTDTLPNSHYLYLPIQAGGGSVGVLGVRPRDARRLRDPEQLHLLETFATQVAAAVERARLAEETRRAEQAIEMSRLKSEFVSTASHELRTPLSSLSLALELLEERLEVEPSERELVRAAVQDAARLRALVDDLLDLAKLESGRVQLELVSVAPEELVEEAVAGMKLQAAQAEIGIEADTPPELPPVLADHGRVVRVLVNLIANAIHYTPPGGRIVVSADDLAGTVQFAVADNGRGIPIEDQARIFDRFIQLRDGAGGTGLGLAIARQTVRAHGGEIWVDSGPGPGSVFNFTIPAVAGAGFREERPQ